MVELLDHQVAAGGRTLGFLLSESTGTRDARLLLAELVHADGVRVERLKETVTLAAEIGKFAFGCSFGRLLGGQYRIDVIEHERSDRLDPCLRHDNAAPLFLDECLEEMGLRGDERAAVLHPLAAEAVEVVVEDSRAVPALLEGQGLAAIAAVQRAFEVVRVNARLLAALVAGRLHGLDLGVQGLVDQRLVVACVLDALEADDADVVAVVEDVVDVRVGDRRARTVRPWQGHDVTLVHLFADHRNGPLAGGVVLVDPPDPGAAFGVDDDVLHLATVSRALAAVDVAERGRVDGAAALGLLEHPFAGLGGEVAAVELGDRAHDPVEQHAAGGLVDVLRAGDECCAGLGQAEVDLDVIDAVAGEAVDLVDDYRGDAVFLDVGEHALQLGPVG